MIIQIATEQDSDMVKLRGQNSELTGSSSTNLRSLPSHPPSFLHSSRLSSSMGRASVFLKRISLISRQPANLEDILLVYERAGNLTRASSSENTPTSS